MSSTGDFTSWWLRRAKVLQVVGRTMLAYPELLRLIEDDSLVSQHFAPTAEVRERVFMYTFCLLPPDAPIKIPVFLQGAQHAAQAVHQELFALANAPGRADEGTASRLELSEVAVDQCLDVWKTHVSELKRRLQLPETAGLVADRLEIKRCGLAEIDYMSSIADDGGDEEGEKEGEKAKEPEHRSIFGLNESVRIKVRFEATEHVRTEDQASEQEPLACDSVFEWTFESNVSRDELVDWVVVKATPFKALEPPAADKAQADKEKNNDQTTQSGQ